VSVEKRPNGRWRARVYSKGHVITSRTFDLKRDADAWHNEQVRRIQLGDWVDPRRADVLMADLFGQYLEATKVGSNPKTYDLIAQHIRSHLSPRLGSRPASTISVGQLEAFYRELLSTGLSESTVRRIRDSLSAVYSWAIRNEILRNHTARDSRVASRTKQPQQRMVAPFTDNELAAMLAAQRELHPPYALLTEFAALSGLRWGEIAALRVGDVKLDHPIRLLVHRSRSALYAEKGTKSGLARRVPLVPRAVDVISELIAGKQPADHVFTTVRGLPVEAANYKRAVRWAQTSGGHRFHDLRHTAATQWLHAGIDVTTVSKWLGHANPTITYNVYSHYLGEASDLAALEKLTRRNRDDSFQPE